MTNIPEHIVREVRRLAERGEPVAEIAFLTRLTEQAICEIIAEPSPQKITEEEPQEITQTKMRIKTSEQKRK
jgi:hypothetical protein